MIEFKNETDRLAFLNGIKEIELQLSAMDDCREQVKNIVDALHSSLDVPKPYIRKVARLFHKKAGAAFEEETTEIKGLYNALKKQ
jgi:hypothetical protein